MEETDFNAFVLKNMPHFISVNYQRLLEAQSPQQQVEILLHIYNLMLRVLTVILVNQYLIRDMETFDRASLNRLLHDQFEHLTASTWKNILFTALEEYKGKKNLLFMPELHDFYWDTTTLPYREHSTISEPFYCLTQMALAQEEKRFLKQDGSNGGVLAEELMEHLRYILQGLSFLKKYDLIRILELNDETYTFEMHRGTRISKKKSRPLPKHADIVLGQFYLRAREEDFLQLSPWLVSWDKIPEENESRSISIGVYNQKSDEGLQYLLTTPGRTHSDKLYVNAFREVVRDIIEDKKQDKRFILTWAELRSMCEKITKQQTSTVQHKYQEDLYVQHEHVRHAFDAFLADPEKRGFVLVGKSGVGKSNFLLAWSQELQQKRGDICVLMYDAGSLLGISATSKITDLIKQSFNNLLHQSGQQVREVWQELDKIHGIEQRQVILCVDAINENPKSKELLKQLNELLVQEPWPWLKIVLSSRPETWKAITHGIKLAQHFYYRDQSVETLRVGLEPFSYSEQMEPFSRQELPVVYAKYQHKFHLQTPYSTLSSELREILGDPLNLLLLADTYKGQAIPTNVKTSELVQRYVNALDVRTLIERKDLEFLEDELVPLLVRRGSYKNTLSEEDLKAAGKEVHAKVFSNAVLDDGGTTNQSFQRLVDVDILARTGHTIAIQFKYERFYEYFVGAYFVKSISKLSSSQKVLSYEEKIEAISSAPFLWGAVRNALVQEAKVQEVEVLVELCFSAQQRVKDMLVNVLVSLGTDEREQVEVLLKRLVSEEKNIWRTVSKPAEEADLRTRNARKIAIEVASNLKLISVLQHAALQKDSTIRAIAVRYSYYLWQRDRLAGFAVLQYIAEKTSAGMFSNRKVIDAVVGLSAIIFFEHYQEQEVLNQLQSIWRPMIARVFLQETTWNTIRNLFIKLAVDVVFILLRDLPAYGTMVTYQAFEAFFHLGMKQKAVYRNLVHYLDVDGQYVREQMERDYVEALQIDNALVSVTALMGLTAHACRDPQNFLPFLQRLFEKAKSDVAMFPYLTVIANVAMNVLHRNPMNDEMFDFFVYTAETCHEKYTEHPKKYHSKLAEAPQVATLGPYIIFQYRREGTAKTPWLETRIEAALVRNNPRFFEFLLSSEFPQVALEQELPKAALEVLGMFFQKSLQEPLTKDDKKILKFIIEFLARLRIRYPDEVDDFLEEQKAPHEFRLQVRTNESVEKVGDLIGKKSWFFLRDGMLLGSRQLRSQLLDLFEHAADSKNMQTWADYGIRKIINAIYGDEILHASK